MKLFLIIIAFFCFFQYELGLFWAKEVFAIDSQKETKYFQGAKLLENYIKIYAENIQKESDKLNLSNDYTIKQAYTKLLLMKKEVQSIQDGKQTEKQAKESIQKIITDFKSLNTHIKFYFESIQSNRYKRLQGIQKKYHKAILEVYNAVDSVIQKLSRVLINKYELSKKQKQMVSILIELREENKRLQNFWNLHFLSEEEMKDYIKIRIKNIRTHMTEIKSLVD